MKKHGEPVLRESNQNSASRRRFRKTWLNAFRIFALILAAAPMTLSQDDDLPVIEGASIQSYREFKIEILTLNRVPEYQAYFPGTTRPSGRKSVPPAGHEIVVISLRTTRVMPLLGHLTGLSVRGVDLISEDGKTFEGNLDRFIGNAKTRFRDPSEIEYVFPVVVPTGTRFRFVQIRHSIQRDTQPYIVIQKIRFVVSNVPH